MTEEFRAALAEARGIAPTANSMARLVDRYGSEAARFAFEQWDLRSRARAKFARADSMFFIREALEQATHERVAAYHASLFPPDVHVTDMTAGIGADLIALAARGPATGYELDPRRAEFARENLAAHGLAAEVRVADSLDADLGKYAFADPARRTDGARTRDLHAFSPDPFLLTDRFRSFRLGVMKLGPGTADTDLDALAPRVEFVSYGGECREALVMVGGDPWRGAVHVESGNRLASGSPAAEGEPVAWLHDPDPAAVRAGATGTLAREHRLLSLGGYLTGSLAVTSPWLRPYRILWSGRPDVSDLNRALRELQGRAFESKSRAGGTEAQRLLSRLKPGGDRPLSLVTWRSRARVVAALVDGS